MWFIILEQITERIINYNETLPNNTEIIISIIKYDMGTLLQLISMLHLNNNREWVTENINTCILIIQTFLILLLVLIGNAFVEFATHYLSIIITIILLLFYTLRSMY